jgi:hypothetical protein
MDELAAAEKKLTTYRDKVNELAEPVDMEDFTGKGILLDDFITEAKQRQRSKESYVLKAAQVGKDISRLRDAVNKQLFKGIPELEKATMDTIKQLREQAFALGKLDRKVGETVRFGDSEAAMQALQQFEKDEIELAPEIEARFKGIVTSLRDKYKLTAGKVSKRVTKKKTKKKASKKKAAKKKARKK